MHDFTPIHAVVGGVLIALALAVMLIATGRIVGLSGVVAGVLVGGDRAWRAWFLGGALAAGAAFELVAPATYDGAPKMPLPVIAISGLLVGYGTRLCNGCTSGHGLCGVGRLSVRSLIATTTFFGIGVATACVLGRLA